MANIPFSNYSARRGGKRRQVSREECLHDLKDELPRIFMAFNKAVKKYNKVASMFNPNAKVRFDAAVLNTAIIESLQDAFSDYCRWGKYKRFILRLKDYIFLVKKFNGHDKPMNIKTQHVNTISNQLSLPLFNDEIYQDDPIIFFGYKIDRSGEIFSPQIVYIDENQVKWIVSEDDIFNVENLFVNEDSKKEVNVSWKGNSERKASNN
ncbi:hypothetical protein [Leeuwenhoekiella nanhaiensis]|uniref:Uncharacterized protein n=1 Tax=Leeuwenhoekiella nanhaiensis TaxID=1655491 RepID=A0A2G1VTV0_9FLAO|nr:hypothetical protein [Leeuwenhoekiella nanhaiensis]PHQ30185.1 hypothetical protein CJ305_04270 [Leeuwenhoekiella nanhaiensis]